MQWTVCAVVCAGFLSLGPSAPLRAAAWVASLLGCVTPVPFCADCLTKGGMMGHPHSSLFPPVTAFCLYSVTCQSLRSLVLHHHHNLDKISADLYAMSLCEIFLTGLLARSLYKLPIRSIRGLLARSLEEISLEALQKSFVGKISLRDLLARSLYKISKRSLCTRSLQDISCQDLCAKSL